MTPLLNKLNLGSTAVLHVLNAPASFEPQLAALTGVEIQRDAAGPVRFAMSFVQTLDEVQRSFAQLARAAQGDAVIWMVYPKASSKRYPCEFSRDTGWSSLGEAGYEPVRQVAVDDDWSALRFRRAEYIKSMKRNPDGAISAVGRDKARRQREAVQTPRPK